MVDMIVLHGFWQGQVVGSVSLPILDRESHSLFTDYKLWSSLSFGLICFENSKGQYVRFKVLPYKAVQIANVIFKSWKRRNHE